MISMKNAIFCCAPLALALAACGSGGDNPAGTVAEAAAGLAGSIDSPAVTPVNYSRAEIEQIYTCSGLISAAVASRIVLSPDQIPSGLESLKIGDGEYWYSRMGEIAPDALTEAERQQLTADSIRIFPTGMALEEEADNIRTCMEAGRSGS